MKNTKLFQYVVIGLFIFFTIVGAILFSLYKTKDSANTRINITMWGTPPSESFRSFYSKYFSENQLEYNINYVEKDPTTFDRDLVEALAIESGPDAIILSVDQIIRYRDMIYTIPYAVLPELSFKETFVRGADLFLNNEGAVALPFMIDPLVMYWNEDIFINAGITKTPVSWSEITNLVSKFTVKDSAKNISRSAVALGEYRNVDNAKEILSTLFIQAGNPIVTKNQNENFASTLKESLGQGTSASSLALQFFTNFSNPNRAEYSWNRSLPRSIESFTNGDLAIYLGFASEFMTIKNKNPNLNFEVALLPQGTGIKTVKSTFGKIYGFAILKKSKNPAGTYTVINSLSSVSAYPYWKDIFNIPSARKDSLNKVDNSAIKTIFNQSAIISKGWIDPNKTETAKVFQEMVESYTTGRDNLTGAINTASERIDSLFK